MDDDYKATMATNTLQHGADSPWNTVEFTEDFRFILFKAKTNATPEQQTAWLEAHYPEKHWRWRTTYARGDHDLRTPIVMLWKQAAPQ